MLGLQTESLSKVWKPWGWYTILTFSEELWVKELVLMPRCRTSLQVHWSRTELWYCPSGQLIGEIGGKTVGLDYDRRYRVPPGINHRLINPTSEPLSLIEIATGAPREDDIERLEDDYGRAN